MRAPLAESICVQGAPAPARPRSACTARPTCSTPTGSSSPAPACWSSGPTAPSCATSSRCCPALGEVEVDQATVADLTGRVPVRAEDPDDVAVLKGDARLADVLHRALWRRVTKPRDSVQVPLSGRRYRIPEERLKRYVDDLRRAGVSYGAGRERLALSLAEDARRQKEEVGGSPTDAETRRCARSAEVRAFCDQHWPAVDAAALVAEVLADPSVGAGVLTGAEQELLRRASARSVRATPGRRPTPSWSTRWPAAGADAGLRARGGRRGAGPLPDAVPGGRPPPGRGVADRARRPGAGHQPVVGRGLVGDARGAGPAGHRGAAADHRVPGARGGAGVRQPVAAGARARARPATAVRSEPGSLQVRPVSVLAGRWPTSSGRWGRLGGDRLRGRRGRRPVAALGLSGRGRRAGRRRREPAPVAVVPATLVKGWSSTTWWSSSPPRSWRRAAGLHRLYVALTRAVSSLVVLHRGELPDLLAA